MMFLGHASKMFMDGLKVDLFDLLELRHS